MMITPHVLVGAALATRISNPFALVFFAVVSHFVIDMIPHHDYDINPLKKKFYKIFIDGAIAAASLWYFIAPMPFEQQALCALGGFFGIFPDGLWMLHRLFGWKFLGPYVNFHYKLHWLLIRDNNKAHPAIWFATQAIAVVLSFYALSPLFL